MKAIAEAHRHTHAALFRASESTSAINVPAAPLEFEPGVPRLIDFTVRAGSDVGARLFLVIFNERETTDARLELAHRPAQAEGVVRRLERELELLKRQLRSFAEKSCRRPTATCKT